MSDAHDFHVLLCPALLTEFNGMKYAYAHTITRQFMMASGAFQIENPDKAADGKAIALAAVESVLKIGGLGVTAFFCMIIFRSLS